MLRVDDEMKKKKYSEFEQSQDDQLDFFHFIAPRDREFSNTVHLYDALPKYTVSAHALKRDGKFLESKEARLKYQGKTYRVKVFPGRVKDWKDGKEKDFLPGQSEEIVEDVIRKISLDHRRRGKYVDKHYSVVFSYKEVLKYLKESGHEMRLCQLKQSLKILSRSTLLVEIEGERNALLEASFFPIVGQVDDEANETAGKNFVVFNPLVTHEIGLGNFHLLHLDKCLALKRYLSRWLFKRLSQRYTQASYKNMFGPIKYSTIEADSGIEPYSRIYMGIKNLEKALDELQDKEVISMYEKEVMKEGRKIIDAAFKIWPHPEFVKNMKYSNQRHTQMRARQNVRKLTKS